MAKPRMMKKLPMIRKERGRSHHAKREFPKLLFPRCESNEEIMHRSALTRGYVLIRFQPQIKHPDTGTFAGYRGGALMVQLPTAEDAKLFVEQVEMAIRELAQLAQDFHERLTRQKAEHTTPWATPTGKEPREDRNTRSGIPGQNNSRALRRFAGPFLSRHAGHL